MKIDMNPKSPTFGRMAYHSLHFRDDGGVDYIQYDFDGSIEDRHEYRPAPEPLPRDRFLAN